MYIFQISELVCEYCIGTSFDLIKVASGPSLEDTILGVYTGCGKTLHLQVSYYFTKKLYCIHWTTSTFNVLNLNINTYMTMKIIY